MCGLNWGTATYTAPSAGENLCVHETAIFFGYRFLQPPCRFDRLISIWPAAQLSARPLGDLVSFNHQSTLRSKTFGGGGGSSKEFAVTGSIATGYGRNSLTVAVKGLSARRSDGSVFDLPPKSIKEIPDSRAYNAPDGVSDPGYGAIRTRSEFFFSIVCTCNPSADSALDGLIFTCQGNGNLALLGRGQRRTPTTVSVPSTCRVTAG
jgi:hypothetical protein